jgi:hypothetical protein
MTDFARLPRVLFDDQVDAGKLDCRKRELPEFPLFPSFATFPAGAWYALINVF